MSARGLIVLAVAAGGCSLDRFEDLQNRAWADSSGLPAGLDSEDYPVALAALVTDLPGLHAVAVSTAPPGLATISYDRFGSIESRGIALEGVPADALPTVAAATAPVAGSDGAVVVGNLGERDALLLYDARSGTTGPVLNTVIEGSTCGAGLTELGRHMVFTPTSVGDPAQPDLIVSAGAELLLFSDLRPGATPACKRCTLQAGTVLSMVAADFDPETDGDEIAVGLGGSLLVFHADLIEFHHDAGAACFTQNSPMVTYPSLGEPDFGARLAVGDETMSGVQLAIAAPSANKVYVVRELGTSGPGPVATVIGQAASAEFASTLVFGDFDHDARELDELAIGDPGTSVGAVERAGSVWIYKVREGAGFELELTTRLHDAQPQPDQHFGRSVIAAEFVGAADDADVLLAGAAGELFTFFRALAAATDPRE